MKNQTNSHSYFTNLKYCLIYSLWGTVLLFSCNKEDDLGIPSNDPNPILCNDTRLDTFASHSTYHAFGTEHVSSTMGYGIYSTTATATLALLSTDNRNEVLQLDYTMPQNSWWLSIRKAFLESRNLMDCAGIAFDLKVLGPSNARLRVTICDHPFRYNSDEMWWFDLSYNAISSEKDWATIFIPFSGFYQSYGEGSRRNNSALDKGEISAFEFNFLSSAPCSGKILIDNIRTY